MMLEERLSHETLEQINQTLRTKAGAPKISSEVTSEIVNSKALTLIYLKI